MNYCSIGNCWTPTEKEPHGLSNTPLYAVCPPFQRDVKTGSFKKNSVKPDPEGARSCPTWNTDSSVAKLSRYLHRYVHCMKDWTKADTSEALCTAFYLLFQGTMLQAHIFQSTSILNSSVTYTRFFWISKLIPFSDPAKFFTEFYAFCTLHYNIIETYEPTKCTFVKLLF